LDENAGDLFPKQDLIEIPSPFPNRFPEGPGLREGLKVEILFHLIRSKPVAELWHKKRPV